MSDYVSISDNSIILAYKPRTAHLTISPPPARLVDVLVEKKKKKWAGVIFVRGVGSARDLHAVRKVTCNYSKKQFTTIVADYTVQQSITSHRKGQ